MCDRYFPNKTSYPLCEPYNFHIFFLCDDRHFLFCMDASFFLYVFPLVVQREHLNVGFHNNESIFSFDEGKQPFIEYFFMFK